MPDSGTRVLAIRHGETLWNVDGRIQGHLDIPLNDTGAWQARRLAAALEGETIDAIYASDLLRAYDTARAVGQPRGLAVMPEPALRERHFGEFQGHSFKEIEAQHPDLAERWRKREVDFAPPGGGESLQTFYARCVGAATRLAAAHPGQTIALVAHGGVMDCLYRAATRIDLQAPRSWQLGNASLNRLLYTGEGFTLVGWGDVAHLDEGPRDDATELHGDGPADRVGFAA